MARLRPLAILDATIQGEKGQPSDADLKRIGKDILAGKTWVDVFKGASAIVKNSNKPFVALSPTSAMIAGTWNDSALWMANARSDIAPGENGPAFLNLAES